jgi:F0F1-type ATP synthase membrane subunit a
VLETVANLAPPFTQWLVPLPLMLLSVFVALVQTFVFILLSQLYLSEVSHAPHDHAHGDEHHVEDELIAPVLT